MNIPENFLTRWSRRKSAAAEDEESPAVSSLEASGEAAGSEGAAGPNARTATPPHCPASRPTRLDLHLIRPACPRSNRLPRTPTSGPSSRRACRPTDPRRAPPRLAADPNIRNSVGLADYDWDFNAPGSMAGFGSLEMTDELRRVTAQIIGPAPDRNQTAGILR
jgi:hypothetical protein